MSIVDELCRGHKRLQPLIELALSEGWEVSRTAGGHLRFMKPGFPLIFTRSTAFATEQAKTSEQSGGAQHGNSRGT